MTDERSLTAEDRRRNVRRALRVEERLGAVEADYGTIAFSGARAMREVRALREELRSIFGLEPLGGLAPLYEKTATAGALKEAEDAVLALVPAGKRKAAAEAFERLRRGGVEPLEEDTPDG